MLALLLLVATLFARCQSLTDPLPEKSSVLRQDTIHCQPGEEFKWDKTEPEGNNMKITYNCGGKEKQEKEYKCAQGFKASSKRDEICDPGPDPNFGIFREGKDPNVMDTAKIVYFCMKDTVNKLNKC